MNRVIVSRVPITFSMEEYNFNPYYDIAYNDMNADQLFERKQLLSKTLIYSQMLRIFTVINGVFLLFWALYEWPFIFPLLLTILGYYGAKHYQTPLILIYTIYIILEASLRIYWLVEKTYDRVYFTVIMGLGLFICLYITFCNVALMYYTDRLNQTELNMLRDINHLWYTDSVVFINAHPNYYTSANIPNNQPSTNSNTNTQYKKEKENNHASEKDINDYQSSDSMAV